MLGAAGGVEEGDVVVVKSDKCAVDCVGDGFTGAEVGEEVGVGA